ncbi:MAG: 16S rRNA (uracil(1498)-N(3))-methyltransferase [Lachnospiraceae bacterium]|nr:16S rRNA (uracil(1498)-N(3))-methyltransferase [Lachnospiraceae bacterium]
MYRFFVDKNNIFEDKIAVEGQDVNHIKNVLRMKIGETVLLSDGEDREYICEISEIEEDRVLARIIDIEGPSRELSIKVTLFQGLPKGDKMETVIQKMVELGGYSIVPVATKRSIVKLDAKKAGAKVARWNAISESAAKQSKRGIVPEVLDVMTFGEAIKLAKDFDKILIPYEEAENMDYTRKVVDSIEPGDSVAVFIGPEGGFAPEEVSKALEVGAKSVTLGRRILRTETAGMALMSVLMYAMEE